MSIYNKPSSFLSKSSKNHKKKVYPKSEKSYFKHNVSDHSKKVFFLNKESSRVSDMLKNMMIEDENKIQTSNNFKKPKSVISNSSICNNDTISVYSDDIGSTSTWLDSSSNFGSCYDDDASTVCSIASTWDQSSFCTAYDSFTPSDRSEIGTIRSRTNRSSILGSDRFDGGSDISATTICSTQKSKNKFAKNNESHFISTSSKLNIKYIGLLMILAFITGYYCFIKLKEVYNYADKPPIPLVDLHNKLSKCLVGQEDAVKLIVNDIQTLDESDSLLHLRWWTGPPGVGKTLATRLVHATLNTSVFIQHVSTHLLVEGRMVLLSSIKPNLLFIEASDLDTEAVSSVFSVVANHWLLLRENTASLLVIFVNSWGSHFPPQSEQESEAVIHQRIQYASTVGFVYFNPLKRSHVDECIARSVRKLFGIGDKCSGGEEVNDAKVDEAIQERAQIEGGLRTVQERIWAALKGRAKNDIAPFGCRRIESAVEAILFRLFSKGS